MSGLVATMGWAGDILCLDHIRGKIILVPDFVVVRAGHRAIPSVKTEMWIAFCEG